MGVVSILRIHEAYYARFADFFFEDFFADFFAAFFFEDFFAAFFFAAIKIFLLCKSESINKFVFMITTVIITLDTLSMSFIQLHTIVNDRKYVDNFFENIFYKKRCMIINCICEDFA